MGKGISDQKWYNRLSEAVKEVKYANRIRKTCNRMEINNFII